MSWAIRRWRSGCSRASRSIPGHHPERCGSWVASPAHPPTSAQRFRRTRAQSSIGSRLTAAMMLVRSSHGSSSSSAITAHGLRTSTTPGAPSWELRPSVALVAIDLMRQSDDAQAPSVRNSASVEERERVASDIRSKIADDAETVALFESALTSAHLFLAGRERGKTNTVRVINEARVALYEYGRRLVERGVIDDVEQLFMVTDEELDALRAEPESFTDIISERWMQYRQLFDYEPVFAVNGRVPRLDEMVPRADKQVASVSVGDVLAGAAGSGGVASGRARVVTDAGDPAGLEPGDVLIAPQTDPAWVPLMVPAAAVVVNVGAAGSHAMIVSRELGIPCVVSVEDASETIPDGAMVTVDGNAGTVTIDSLPD